MNYAQLYTITGCAKCAAVRRTLERKGICFDEIDLLQYPQEAAAVAAALGQVVTPALFYRGTWCSPSQLLACER